MSEDAVYHWKITRKDSVFGDLAVRVLSNPLKAISRASIREFCASALALACGVILAAVAGLLLTITIPQLLLYALGSVFGHQVIFVLTAIVSIALFCVLVIFLSAFLYYRCYLAILERQFSQVELMLKGVDRTEIDTAEYQRLVASCDETRRAMNKAKSQFDTHRIACYIKYMLLSFLWLASYLLSSPCSPFLGGFSGEAESLMQWHLWFTDVFANALFFDLPNTLFGSFSSISPASFSARVVVSLYKTLIVSSLIFYLAGTLRQYWRKTEVFIGTRIELDHYLEYSGLFLDRGNYTVECEWQLVPAPKQ